MAGLSALRGKFQLRDRMRMPSPADVERRGASRLDRRPRQSDAGRLQGGKPERATQRFLATGSARSRSEERLTIIRGGDQEPGFENIYEAAKAYSQLVPTARDRKAQPPRAKV